MSSAPNSLEVTLRKQLSSDFVLDVKCNLAAGITILFGASGAGKTSLLNCIAGLTTPETGRIAIADRVLFESERRINVPARDRNVGYMFQDLALFPHLTVLDNVQYGLARLDGPARRAAAERMLEAFRIAHLSRRKPGQISGGERRRAALARALVTDPCCLLLDEPLAGLDAPTRSRLFEDLRLWNRTHQVPVLCVTHSREEVFALGERVVVIEAGRVIAEGSPYELLEAPRREVLANLAGFENVFDAAVVSLHDAHGTMTCAINGTAGPQIEAPLARVTAGDRLRLALRAGDIMLAAAAPQGLSARNVLAGRIIRLTRRDALSVAEVDCGIRFVVHLTPAAVDSLGLAPGSPVWLVFKTHSCHILEPATP